MGNLLCLDKQMGISEKKVNIHNFLRFEWMYAKFRIKVLNNSRLDKAFKIMFSLIIFFEV